MRLFPAFASNDVQGTIEMTFDQALEALKDAWIERCLLGGGGARLNARLFAARRLTDSHPEFDRRRYDAAFDDANRIIASHRRTLQAWVSRFHTIPAGQVRSLLS
jgi:hypothetical protein